jgi:Mg-chelatase subunit ChlI
MTVKSYSVYPFSALVGQDRLKQALILNAINPHIGGVLIRGEKGTAKSTAVRGLARLLPPITVVKGCAYNCAPDACAEVCQVCTAHDASPQTLSTLIRPTQLVELPVSATEDRLVGSLDIEHAITEGQRRFEPGLLAQANRGLLYVDEVNLLDDHLVDILLDAAAMGVNTVEREGVSITHPARFILVGTMNPEEGELRPQLLDRFGLAVEIRGLTDVESRTLVIERRMKFEADPEKFVTSWQPQEDKLAKRIVEARVLLPQVRVSKTTIMTIARLAIEMQVDGHRADLTILETARTQAAWEGRKTITIRDIRLAAELSVPHRMRRLPFAEGTLNETSVQKAVERVIEQIETETSETTKKKKTTVMIQ